DRNRSHWSTSKTPSYTKSVSWQHHPESDRGIIWDDKFINVEWPPYENYILSAKDKTLPPLTK
ncbi:dTDP-4-dehydrorhamnose 3,5-epimerase family protein, partial [Escherichia coli]|uniref:dTDP-4-dehydrorhamnose 3,5-epimerase family protein n=1 Tax=Escherichia coli TaxID=562 RepID=UPI00203EBC56